MECVALWLLSTVVVTAAFGVGLDDVFQNDIAHDHDVIDMPTELVQKRMDLLFTLIDTNKNNLLDLEELAAFNRQTLAVVHDLQLNQEMLVVDRNKDGFVDLAELELAFEREAEVDNAQYKTGLTKRFNAADKDKDGKLSKQELALLLNPGRDEELIKIEIQEIMETYDQNGDGLVSLEEYSSGRNDDDGSANAEFKPFDTNGDGFLSEAEIRNVYLEETNDEIDTEHEDLFAITGKKPIDRETWNTNLQDIAVSSLTDHGEMLRYPADYGLDLGEDERDRKDGDAATDAHPKSEL